jgi:hypothetical protein
MDCEILSDLRHSRAHHHARDLLRHERPDSSAERLASLRHGDLNVQALTVLSAAARVLNAHEGAHQARSGEWTSPAKGCENLGFLPAESRHRRGRPRR